MTRTRLKDEQKQFIKQIQVFHSYFKNINKFITIRQLNRNKLILAIKS